MPSCFCSGSAGRPRATPPCSFSAASPGRSDNICGRRRCCLRRPRPFRRSTTSFWYGRSCSAIWFGAMCRRQASSSDLASWLRPGCSCYGTRRNDGVRLRHLSTILPCRTTDLRRHCSLVRPLGNDGRYLLDRHRRAEQIALRLVAPESRQEFLLPDGLHALRRGGHAERAGDAHHRLHDHDVLGAGSEIRDEGAVHLDLVVREAPQIAERGVTGAEIINRDANAELLETVQRR